MDITPITAENKLWRAVLEQAYDDAEQPQSGDGSDPDARVRACHYLRADTRAEEEHLKLVCEFAEVPFDRVLNFARKRYACELPTQGAEILSDGSRNFRSARQKAPRTEDETCRLSGCAAG